MKNLKKGILALALLAGISGAFATKHSYAAKKVDTFYNWTGSASAPKNPSKTLSNATVAQAQMNYGCTTGSIDCADGTRVSGPGAPTAQILHN